jgi:UDP-GlcNAc:undecaprenyl-phosphate GlcNAc-1-phosphate transferase
VTTSLIAECLAAGAVAFGLAVPLAAGVRSAACKLGHLDRPGERKRHPTPMPMGGGVAIFWAVAVPLAAATGVSRGDGALPGEISHQLVRELSAGAPTVSVLLLCALVLHLGGLWDDHRGLSPGAKLAVQLLASAPLVVWFGARVLPEWLDPISGSLLGLLWLLATTNAFNFLDGADGLAGTVGALCGLMFVVAALLSGQALSALLLSLLTGALLGFLCFNFPPATLFMGDGGSMTVGFLLGFGSLRMTYFDPGAAQPAPWWAVFTPVVILAIPLYDLVGVVGIRLRQGRNPLEGDDQHFLHRLARRGLGPWRVVAVVGSCTLATGLGGVLLGRLEGWQAFLVLLQAAMVVAVLVLLEIHDLPGPGGSSGSAGSETPP